MKTARYPAHLGMGSVERPLWHADSVNGVRMEKWRKNYDGETIKLLRITHKKSIARIEYRIEYRIKYRVPVAASRAGLEND